MHVGDAFELAAEENDDSKAKLSFVSSSTTRR
jgi:hypothetical protein